MRVTQICRVIFASLISWVLLPAVASAQLPKFECAKFDSRTKENDKAASQWLRDGETSYQWSKADRWSLVPRSNFASAQSLLISNWFIKLDEHTARELLRDSKVPPQNRGGVPYLLRAVGDAQGEIQVRVNVGPNGQVWIEAGTLSHCPVARQRRAVVVWLDRAPTQVLVTFSVAE